MRSDRRMAASWGEAAEERCHDGSKERNQEGGPIDRHLIHARDVAGRYGDEGADANHGERNAKRSR